MWSGSSSAIPSGWLLCNGSNGTPDLRDRFIVGAGSSYNVGNTGGEASHTLSVAEMPSHNHSFTGNQHTHTLSLNGLTCSSAGEHNHSYTINNSPSANAAADVYCTSYTPVKNTRTYYTSSAGAHTHTISGTGSINSATVSGTVGNSGSGYAHENRPPYYALCFIMKS